MDKTKILRGVPTKITARKAGAGAERRALGEFKYNIYRTNETNIT